MAEAKRAKMGWMKKVAIAAATAVVLLAVLVILAPRFIDWEKVRKTAETEGSKALGREVRIKSLHVSLLSGIEIGGFRVGGARGTGQPALVEADRVVAKYRLLPLLWLKVVINRIELDRPKLWVGKSESGRLSFSDLIAAAPAAESSGGHAKPVVLPVAVHVDTIKVAGAVLAYRDASVHPAFSAGVDHLDMVVKGFSLSGTPAAIKVSCVANMDGKTVPVAVEGDLGIALDRSVLTLHGFRVTVPGVGLNLGGEVTEFQTLPTLKLAVDQAVDLTEVWKAYREFIPKGIRDWMTVGGKVTGHTAVTGTSRRPGLEGTLVAHGVAVGITGMKDAMENLEGTFKFTGDTLTTSDARFIALGSPYTLDADLKNVGITQAALGGFDLKKYAVRGKFTVESPRIVLDRFLPPLDAKTPAGAKGAKPVESPPPPEPDYRGMLPVGVELEGRVAFKEVVARRVKFTGIVGTVRLAGGNVAYDLKDTSYGGHESATGQVLLTRHPLEFAVEGKVAGWQGKAFVDDAVDTFVAQGKEMKGRISGTAGAEYRITGRGITLPSMKKALAGSGKFLVENGAISRFKFFENGLGKVLKLGWLSKDLPFKTAGGSFTLGAGKMHTPDMAMDPGPDGDLGVSYNGDVDFDMKLKGEMATRFHPRHADEVMKGDVGKLLFIKEGEWAVGYWDVTGSATLPILTPSKKHLTQKARQEATQEIRKQLPELKDKAKDTLKGLFGKKKKK